MQGSEGQAGDVQGYIHTCLVCFDLIFKLSRYADIIYKLDKKEKKKGEIYSTVHG